MAYPRVLIANIAFGGRSGTEVVTEEIARSLSNRGRGVAVYSANLGTLASQLQADGIKVVDRIEDLPWIPDVVHSNHFIVAAFLKLALPCVPQIVFCHDATAWHDHPYNSPSIRKYAAVDLLCKARIEKALPYNNGNIVVVHNAVDLARFPIRPRLPDVPARGLILAKDREHVAAVKAACQKLDIRVSAIGPAFGDVVDNLGERLQDFDVVFASARMALESMAVGLAVVVVDGRGLGGLVSSENVMEWRDWNFGRHILKKAATDQNLVTELQNFDPNDAEKVRDAIRLNNSLSDTVDRLELMYADAATAIEPNKPDKNIDIGRVRESERLLRSVYPPFRSKEDQPDSQLGPDKLEHLLKLVDAYDTEQIAEIISEFKGASHGTDRGTDKWSSFIRLPRWLSKL